MPFLKSLLIGFVAILLNVLAFAGYYGAKSYWLLRNLKNTQEIGVGAVVGTGLNFPALILSSTVLFVLAFAWQYRRGR